MSRPNEAEYLASRIEWNKLRSWARRVAQVTPCAARSELELAVTEPSGQSDRTYTKRVLGRHWVLDTRMSDVNEWSTLELLSDQQVYYMVLEADGSLTTVLHVDRRRHRTSPNAHTSRTEIDSNYAIVAAFSDRDVTYFDYEKRRVHWKTEGSGRWPGEAMNEIAGGRLLRHAKGVGLSMRLKELSNGPLSTRPTR